MEIRKKAKSGAKLPAFLMIAIAIVSFLGIGNAVSLSPQLTKTAFIDEIQVFSDNENGNEYSYAKVYFTPVNTTTQECWVIPLQKNGIDITGSKYLQALLQQALAAGNKVFLHAVDTWGLGSQSYFSLFEIPRIRRAILYK